MEFHISRQARRCYRFEDSLFSFNGNVIFANFHAARVFAQRMNEVRNTAANPHLAIRSGQINALGLIDEILHYVVGQYRTRMNPALYDDLLAWLEQEVGKRKLNTALRAFLREFPPVAVYQGKLDLNAYLAGASDGIPHRAAAAEELLMLWLGNQNPAFQPYQELFDDSNLKEKTAYSEIADSLHAFFETQPRFGPDGQNLVDMLRSPAIAVPHSLNGQLEYIRSRWGELLGHYLLKLLGSLNLISEEERLRGLGPGPVRIPTYADRLEGEEERFSRDADWMPHLVLIAKNTYVWLDQLSKAYKRAITRLDQIPDEELDKLADWGISGLWLIGLWERSTASARIKQLCGNPEAIASAYSLKDYRIAEELGGEAACQNLRERAWRRGIRLASDMVPNHMGIDSNWLYEHPDWFISMPYSPFPSYTFTGENLSADPRAAVQIEDHYYTRSDAAVVFKYHDNAKNSDKFIYHGNDGTSMPWNDTAQLNYLNPAVREAVIQKILSIARNFPIIRFDAAMTLARRHFQRLWFPLPGGGCDIPSRSEFSLTAEQFNQYMPQEFWREVVERVAAEAPDTLLLAEAFWLMESYFVRTLGMHRVYNSAFMNLLRDEDNAKYRQLLKNTLEFDPQILKRYVNFMNNPDEQTAASQFGKGDKYFGICTLLATMPGLPMFGHGQVEGFSEKYGMEYKRAYIDEVPDQGLIDRHHWQIFPLLKKRYLFSEVERFYVYDFYTADGLVDENVYAYSNRSGDERALVLYHNKFGDTAGWVRTSAAFMDKQSGTQRQVDLRAGLDLPAARDHFVVFRDSITGLEYIRSCAEIAQKGLYVQLDAYRAHVFLDFRVMADDGEGHWRRVHDHLNGRGTSDIQRLRWELPLQPVLGPLREIFNPGYFAFLLKNLPQTAGGELPEFLLNEAGHKMAGLVKGAQTLLPESHKAPAPEADSADFRERLRLLNAALWIDQNLALGEDTRSSRMMTTLRAELHEESELALLSWTYLEGLRAALGMEQEKFARTVEEWRFLPLLEEALRGMGIAALSPGKTVQSVRLLLTLQGWAARLGRRGADQLAGDLVQNADVRHYLQFNIYAGKRWFKREAFESFWTYLAAEGMVELLAEGKPGGKLFHARLEKLAGMLNRLRTSAQEANYEEESWLESLGKPGDQT
jgi:glycosidase